MNPRQNTTPETGEFERTLALSCGEATARLRGALEDQTLGWTGEASDDGFEFASPDAFAPQVVGRFEETPLLRESRYCVVRAHFTPNPFLRDFVRIVRVGLFLGAVLTGLVWITKSPGQSMRSVIQGIGLAGLALATMTFTFEWFLMLVERSAGETRDAVKSFIDDLER